MTLARFTQGSQAILQQVEEDVAHQQVRAEEYEVAVRLPDDLLSVSPLEGIAVEQLRDLAGHGELVEVGRIDPLLTDIHEQDIDHGIGEDRVMRDAIQGTIQSVALGRLQ